MKKLKIVLMLQLIFLMVACTTTKYEWVDNDQVYFVKDDKSSGLKDTDNKWIKKGNYEAMYFENGNICLYSEEELLLFKNTGEVLYSGELDNYNYGVLTNIMTNNFFIGSLMYVADQGSDIEFYKSLIINHQGEIVQDTKDIRYHTYQPFVFSDLLVYCLGAFNNEGESGFVFIDYEGNPAIDPFFTSGSIWPSKDGSYLTEVVAFSDTSSQVNIYKYDSADFSYKDIHSFTSDKKISNAIKINDYIVAYLTNSEIRMIYSLDGDYLDEGSEEDLSKLGYNFDNEYMKATALSNQSDIDKSTKDINGLSQVTHEDSIYYVDKNGEKIIY